MIFLAKQYGNNFRVVIDSQQLEVQNQPDTLRRIKGSFLDKFSASFNEGGRGQPDYMQCSYDLYGPDTAVALNSFVYVNANLSNGAHIVQLQYATTSWIKRDGYSPEYSFRYSFSPANSWMRPGKVNITLDTSLCKMQLTTSLQEDVYGHPNQWELIGGNASCFCFSYKKPLPVAAAFVVNYKWLIWLGAGILLLLFNIHSIKKYRQVPSSVSPAYIIAFFTGIPAVVLLGLFYTARLTELMFVVLVCSILPAFDHIRKQTVTATGAKKMPFTLAACSILCGGFIISFGPIIDAVIFRLAGQTFIPDWFFIVISFFAVPLVAAIYFLILTRVDSAFSSVSRPQRLN